MFEINNRDVETHTINNHEFSVIKDFYKYPDQVIDWITSFEPFWHKHEAGYFHQGVDFIDKRHHIFTYEIEPVFKFLETVAGQRAEPQHEGNDYFKVQTNYTKFLNHKYDDHYFYPHIDPGKTAVCYLNKTKSNGTNFYKTIKYRQGIEHKNHFIPKTEIELLHHIHSEYNKLIVWNGAKLYHGAAMDPIYTDEWRINQVFFFQQ